MRWSDLPSHGGNIPWAAHRFAIPPEKWIDLSTGISPWSWAVPNLNQNIYQRLPYDLSPLLTAASGYYQCASTELLVVPGSQFAIEHLPDTVARGKVALPDWGYNGHLMAWQRAGHAVIFYKSFSELLQYCESKTISYAVIINPNNPSNQQFSNNEIFAIEQAFIKHQAHNHLLIIDEAFMDATPSLTYINQQRSDSTLILRSVGKFFGLAGIRLGFVHGAPHKLHTLQARCGEWAINGPALAIGAKALSDSAWIEDQIKQIEQHSQAFEQIISSTFVSRAKVHHFAPGRLFHSAFGLPEDILNIFIQLAKRGILTRIIHHVTDHAACLRLGLPGEHLEPVSHTFEELLNQLLNEL